MLWLATSLSGDVVSYLVGLSLLDVEKSDLEGLSFSATGKAGDCIFDGPGAVSCDDGVGLYSVQLHGADAAFVAAGVFESGEA